MKPTLEDFLKCEKVRCVDNTDFFKAGKDYQILDIRFMLQDDCKHTLWYSPDDCFEPIVSKSATEIDTSPDGVKDIQPDWTKAPKGYDWWAVDANGMAHWYGRTPYISEYRWGCYGFMKQFDNKVCENQYPAWQNSLQQRPHAETVTKPNKPYFKDGQKAYCPWLNDGELVTLKLDGDGDLYAQTERGLQAFDCEGYSLGYNTRQPDLFLATQESYESLSKLMPWINFEKPPKTLKGSDLCRAMLDAGWNLVPCVVSNEDDIQASIDDNCQLIDEWHHDYFESDGKRFKYAVPFNPRTGEIYTDDILSVRSTCDGL